MAHVAVAGQPQVKGLAFRTVLNVIAERRGPEVRDKVLAALPRELADAFRYRQLLATGWYPIEWYRDLWSAILRVTGEGVELARYVGREAVYSDLNSVYRALLKVLSPDTVLTVGMRHFSQIYDTGRVEVLGSRPNYARVRCVGCVGFDRAMWAEVFGSSEMLIELAGGVDCRLKIVGGGRDGDADAEAEAHWG
jgi:hypothetical protein